MESPHQNIGAGFAFSRGRRGVAGRLHRPTSRPNGLGLSASQNGLPFTEDLASPAWQEKTAGLVSQAGFNPQAATHADPLLGVAQYLAVQRAEARPGHTRP